MRLPLTLLTFLCLTAGFSPAVAAPPEAGDPSVPLRFSHALHLGEVGLECENCHTTVGESRSKDDNNLPVKAACAVCHDVTDSAACGQCHPPGLPAAHLLPRGPRVARFSHQLHLQLPDLPETMLQALENGRYLGRPPEGARGAIHPGNPCSACHRGLDSATTPGPPHLPTMTDCLVCHDLGDDPFDSCQTCHEADFPLKPPDHTETFFDDHSTEDYPRDSRRCRQCHTAANNPCMQCH